jgi:transcriptional regulator GlxA family with amidase domain
MEANPMTATRTLAILLFDDVEVQDLCGPFEVFTVANHFTDPPAFNVFTVAEKPGPVLTRGSLSVNPHHRLADCLRPDLLLVPGGQGTRQEMNNAVLTDWIKAHGFPEHGRTIPGLGPPGVILSQVSSSFRSLRSLY